MEPARKINKLRAVPLERRPPPARTPRIEIVVGGVPNPLNPFQDSSPRERIAARIQTFAHRIAESRRERRDLMAGVREEAEMDGERLYTGQEIWERLAISRRAFFRWAKKTGLKSYKLANTTRFKWSHVEKALEASKVTPKPRKAPGK